jgi:hypothetical protein
MLRGSAVRVTHPEVDDVFAASSGFGLELIDDIKDIRR